MFIFGAVGLQIRPSGEVELKRKLEQEKNKEDKA